MVINTFVVSSLILLTGCARDAEKVGGPCSYEAFEGTCKLTSVKQKPQTDGQVLITATYKAPPIRKNPYGQPMPIMTVSTHSDKATAIETFLRQHPNLPCTGTYEIKGTCQPFSSEVTLPDAGSLFATPPHWRTTSTQP